MSLKIKFYYCPVLGLKWYEIREVLVKIRSKKRKRDKQST